MTTPEYIRYLVPRLNMFNETYVAGLTETATIAVQPQEIKIPLKMHQQTLLGSLIETEKNASGVYVSSDKQLFLQFGVIGDRVGSGKSLVCLSLIASKHTIPTHRQIIDYFQSTRYYTIRDIPAVEPIQNCNLIIVPHILVKQWYEYIRNQTSLKVLLLRYTRDIEITDLIRHITAHEITLITNTMYKQFEERPDIRTFHWKRIFIDEADTIDIKKQSDFNLQASFIWFITASYMNILYPNGVISYPRECDYDAIKDILCPAAKTAFTMNPGSVLAIDGCKSQLMKNLVNIGDSLRWRLVHRNDDEFIGRSFSLPPINKHIIRCELPLHMRLISDLISPEIKAMLNADDIAGVYRILGVQPQKQENIIHAMTKHFNRELHNAQLKLEYKTHMEYIDEEAKAATLQKLRVEIGRLETRIASLEERIRTYKTDMCCICMCEFKIPVMGKCCGTIWCFECFQTCIKHKPSCPNCRASSPAIEWLAVEGDVEPTRIQKTKINAFLEICKKGSRILVFSDHDNTFGILRDVCDEEGITWNILAGNPDVISNITRRYEEGEIRVLFLNAQHRGAGINLTCTSHVIIYHKMNAATEKQVIGRAYRMGRTDPLEVIYLYNPDE